MGCIVSWLCLERLASMRMRVSRNKVEAVVIGHVAAHFGESFARVKGRERNTR